MKNKNRLLLAFFLLFITGIMNAQMKADFIAKVNGPKVDFENYTSSNPPSSTLIYQWDFGDGSSFYYTGSTSTFSHTYPQTGTYIATLIAIDSSGTFPNDTFSDTIDILCKADFSYIANGNNNFDFIADSLISNDATFYWNFGDGNTSTQRNPNYTYTTPGSYDVYMYFYDSTSGCGDSIFYNINVYNLCAGKAAFGYIDNGSNNFDFIADSSISNNATFYWTFGDGSSSTQRNPNHTFSTNYSYDVFMYFYDSTLGCGDSVFHLIQGNNNNPCTGTASFTYTANGSNNFDFTADSSIGNSAIFYWGFGDGNSSNQRNPNHTYGSAGSYDVYMAYYDTLLGCGDSIFYNINVNPCTGTAAFSYTANGNSNFDFEADSLISNNAVFSWDFADGNYSNQRNPNHTYNVTGTQYSFFVYMYYYDSTLGCGDSIGQNVYSNPDPCAGKADFTYISNGNNNFDFIADSLIGNNAVFYWGFGDGASSNQRNPNYTYGSAGSYNVYMAFYDTLLGCGDSILYNINSNPCVGKAAFSYIDNGNNNFDFIADSLIGSNAVFDWYFGDGNTSTQRNPNHTYSASGSYDVFMDFYDTLLGCRDSVINTININSNLKKDIHVSYVKGPIGPIIQATAVRLYLIEYDSANQALTAIDSADVFNDSIYTFQNVAAGTYLVKAALLPADSDYYDYLPTYSDTALAWSAATPIYHTNSYAPWVSIHMIKGTNPGGSGFIAGYVYQGANKKEGSLENVDVYLTLKDGTPVTFAKTDAEGKYEFKNLAFGEYKLWVEIAGKPSEFYDIVLNQNTPSSVEINFDVNKDEIVKRNSSANVNKILNSNLNLYPNPAKDFLNIKLENDAQNIEIEVYDISGRLVLKNKTNSNEKMDVSNINTGIYYIQVQTDNKTIYRQKFLKD